MNIRCIKAEMLSRLGLVAILNENRMLTNSLLIL